ncbi:cystatin-F-like [Hippoglossus hippoglossus]|uniref:cystatin-F-like n=1 Tax=Hippoglossus hippoglossus TaxID=8267 RepID=UPI00148D9204|nr:cystatin-F-like [Hippoglossus hippoglossus]
MFALFCIVVFASSGRVLPAAGRLMPGQPHAVPTNGTKVLAAARFAVFEFNRVNAEEQFEIVNITSAKIQVVAGINYILEVQLGSRTCRRNGTRTLWEPCDLSSKASSTVKMTGARMHKITGGTRTCGKGPSAC